MFINDRQITISVGSSRKAIHWQPQTLCISELYARLRTPARSTEPLVEYLSYKKPQQDELKDVGGFVAGALSGPRRFLGVAYPSTLACRGKGRVSSPRNYHL